MSLDNSPLFLIKKIKFKTPDGLDEFYSVYSIERMIEIDKFYNFSDEMRDVFIKATEKLGNVKNPENVFSYYHLYTGLNDQLYSLLGILDSYDSHYFNKQDYEDIKKQCIDISNYAKFIFDKSNLMIKSKGLKEVK